ncbi:MAG: c-type cytochrome [Aquamicrobium sp.]|nr:c-type cytochrome [Aquamicrobium sp.]
MAIFLPRRRAVALGAIMVIAGGLALGAVFVLSGAYNVAASVRHFDITNKLIKLTLRRSIDTHSAFVKVPDLQNADLVRLGARHFANGCQPCHAAPGSRQNPIVAGMYPSAPPLGVNADDWEQDELFWIVRHGLKFTGMPQWVGDGRDDEVWAVVAFLRELPGMSEQRYNELAGAAGSRSGFTLEVAGEELFAQCIACHGDDRTEPVSATVPSLDGQKQAYLRRALEEYALDMRQSGMMEPLAAALSREQIETLSERFARMSRRPLERTPAEKGRDSQRERGQHIAMKGIPRQSVPACASCHGQTSAATFPRLAGLSKAYLATQLRLYRQGTRGDSAYGQIMQSVARKLTDEQADDVATYLAGVSDLPSIEAPAPASTPR